MITWLHMKYKYFFILFLAVSCLFGQTTFATEDNIDIKQLSPWWLEGIPEPTLVAEFENLEEELDALSNSRNRYAEMEQKFIESKQIFSENQATQEKILSDLELMKQDISKNIIKNTADYQEITEELSYLSWEIKELKQKQAEMATILKKIFAQGYIETVQNEKNVSMYGLLLGKTFGEGVHNTASNDILRSVNQSLLLRQENLEQKLRELQDTLLRKKATKERMLTRLNQYKLELQETESIQTDILSATIKKQDTLDIKLTDIAEKREILDEKITGKIQNVSQKKQSINAEFEKKVIQYESLLNKRASEYGCETNPSALCTWIKKYTEAERELRNSQTTKVDFLWPLDPKNGFGYHFRDQKYYNLSNKHHNGVDILVDSGNSVVAMADGYILLKNSPSSSSSGIIVLKHAQWYISIYTGINPSKKPLFSQIKQGQEIGKTRTFQQHTTQNNIHIELYEKEKAVDPLEYLNLSNISANLIPARYGWKYIDDLKKSGKSYDTKQLQSIIGFFSIEWDSEPERQKNFLEKYASVDFRSRDMWIEESISESIDPTFTMCIGFAESSLGKNLTTSGNIGNVGNTDSGDRRNFDDARSGIRGISSTLNNNWLGGYITIDQLSGWGNVSSPIYASSPTNWHENIVKCMSAIKWRYVGNKSPFRLSEANLILYQQEWFMLQKDL